MDRDGMHRLLASTESRLKRAWAALVVHLREENPVAAIEYRLHMSEPLLGLDAAAASFAAAERAAYSTAGHAAARALAEPTAIAKKIIYFDDGNPAAVAWATRNRFDRIREITDEQRAVIRTAMYRGTTASANPRAIATEIYDSIGLTAKQDAAVESYRTALQRQQYAAALDRELSSGVSDRVVRAAQSAGRALTDAQVDTAVARYRSNFRVLRAETIARTEAARIAHEGSEELYRQAIERGDVDADQLEATWYHSPTADPTNERDFHRSMHEQSQPWGTPFVSGLGNALRFPGDPSAPAVEVIGCRCARAVRMLAPASERKAA